MASGDLGHQHTRDYLETSNHTSNLFGLLSNNLVLYQTLPYLPVSAILNIAATSRPFRDLLLHGTPSVFRHLDLTQVKTAQFDIDGIDHGGQVWRNVQVDENLTEDDFYSGPLRGIFSSLRRRNILQDVGTLVLDGLSVTSEFLNDILIDPESRVRILSVREVKNLNERKLMQSLRYACRPSRTEGMPRLKALYYFGKKDAAPLLAAPPAAQSAATPRGANISAGWNQKSQQSLKESIAGDGDDWYGRKGRVINKRIIDGWAETLLDCREVLQFDTVLCTGPRHRNSPAFGKTPVTPASANGGSPWGVATFAVGGCASCGSAPEGFTVYGSARQQDLPLLSPVPLHSSNVKSATRPAPTTVNNLNGQHEFVPRCLECIRERYCFSCNQWWCEACYQVPSREEMTLQHVHIVDEANGLNDHELAAFEQPKVKVRMGYCHDCVLKVTPR
ncbi:hypothetical protein F5B22DRAFT_315037 [Xylaria bambusicola]|uniref:uncharacterized protein n=1 Tax=Xylaria bambusicola TaxID=326684 RepID=UPI0020087590|nr:uncharacterized protein F5B22DRAFT_315037 [Xylaria bambusicola]KAI0509764.1 hypothetical protein F5B22DRAFT_315037 [Xylaria bambusicola]